MVARAACQRQAIGAWMNNWLVNKVSPCVCVGSGPHARGPSRKWKVAMVALTRLGRRDRTVLKSGLVETTTAGMVGMPSSSLCLQAVLHALKKLDWKNIMLTNMVVKLGEVLNEVSRALGQQSDT